MISSSLTGAHYMQISQSTVAGLSWAGLGWAGLAGLGWAGWAAGQNMSQVASYLLGPGLCDYVNTGGGELGTHHHYSWKRKSAKFSQY